MKNRHNIKCLINPTREEVLDREPLLAFSYYLSGQNNSLLFLSDEIVKKIDEGFNDCKNINATLIGQASFLMWLWTLGAYEVVRTISQAKKCFSKDFLEKIDILKKELSIVRVANAKMEKKGKQKPVNSNRSPDGWDFDSRDLLVGDPENYKFARKLIKLYDETLCSLKVADVLKRHEESYE